MRPSIFYSSVNAAMKRPIKKEELIQRLYKRRFILPNAVTVGNMFCGFLTIVYATSGRFDKAIVAIALGILLDGFDGKVARKLNATSKFGMEFDSLSDVISFGVAPAVLIYNWCFRVSADEFGVLVTFIYLMGTASRLARFNVAVPDLKHFTGLPSPAAAGAVAALVYLDPFPGGGLWMTSLGAATMLLLSYLMVSRIPYTSIKVIQMHHMPLRGRLAIGLMIALIWYRSQWGFFLLAAGYAASGPLMLLWKRGKPVAEAAAIADEQKPEVEDPAEETRFSADMH